ncbi:somatostatin receptor type 4-like [Leucoraja erinacea]|uniref:somatostatin receptor type 4-like n=1 Tax=Leucoraja erinaceus TaxID=7782 RepID=UPI002455E4FC|nr:somatostatin receptor type 4-like [Leucoraja erinacea]
MSMATSVSWTVRNNEVLSGINSTNETGSGTLAPYSHTFVKTFEMVMICYFPVVIGLGTVGNSVALWHIVRPKRVLATNEVLLLDLIILDFLIIVSFLVEAINIIPAWKMRFFDYASYLVALLNLHGSPSFMTFIAIDQYIAVAHPILFHAWRRPRYYIVLSLIIWLFVLVLTIPVFVITMPSANRACEMGHSIAMGWKIHLLFSHVILSVIPVLVLLVCYALTANKLKEVGVGKESMKLMRKQVLKTIGAILALLLFCFAPFHCGELFAAIMDLVYPVHASLRLYRCYVRTCTWFLTSFAAFLNPLLYIFRSQNFQWRIRCCTV